uniref:Uncharacterized protein n=1 Tax=Nelumbo nucifera TaxID=4432 RepID=A0A822XK43_NELNU|nr:TPA_asm: hypothetical protein HUJ06_022204 [Nelumbo nucifera]
MPTTGGSKTPIKHKGETAAIIVCWLLGNGCLFSWNSMLTIEDYFVYLFPVNGELPFSLCLMLFGIILSYAL